VPFHENASNVDWPWWWLDFQPCPFSCLEHAFVFRRVILDKIWIVLWQKLIKWRISARFVTIDPFTDSSEQEEKHTWKLAHESFHVFVCQCFYVKMSVHPPTLRCCSAEYIQECFFFLLMTEETFSLVGVVHSVITRVLLVIVLAKCCFDSSSYFLYSNLINDIDPKL
jgi:hypothetical protein